MRLLASIILAIMSWVEYIDMYIRIGSGLAAIVVAYFAVRAYISKRRLTDVERLIKEQEFKEKFKQNGRKK